MERQVKTANQVREERREREDKLVNQVSTELLDLPVRLDSQEETEGMDMDAANLSRSTVEAAKFQRVPRTPTTSGMDSATKAILHPMPTALVFLVSVSYAHQRTHTQDGRQQLPNLVAMAMMLFVEPPHWTKRLPGRWYLDVVSARWRAAC